MQIPNQSRNWRGQSFVKSTVKFLYMYTFVHATRGNQLRLTGSPIYISMYASASIKQYSAY